MFSVIPTDKGFHELFEASAATMERTAQAFAELCGRPERAATCVAEIRDLEHEADAVARKTLARLDTTFLTPFDREDIHALVSEVDDVVDAIDAAARRIVLFNISIPNPRLTKQAEVLVEAAACAKEAIGLLRRLRKPAPIRERLDRLHELEKVGDDYHHAALAELYSAYTDAIAVMKLKDIFDRVEKAIDGCEDIADVLERILLKSS